MPRLFSDKNFQMDGKFLIGAGVVYLAYTYFSKKNFAKTAQFSFERLQTDFKKKQLIVTLGIANPTGQSLQINSIVGQLSVNGTDVAAVENFQQIEVKPKGKTYIPLIIKPSGMGILQQLIALIKTKAKNVKKTTAKFVGAANLGGTTFPFTVNLV